MPRPRNQFLAGLSLSLKNGESFLTGQNGEAVFVTIHPSSIFRRREKAEREEEFRHFVSEMKLVQRKLRGMAAA